MGAEAVVEHDLLDEWVKWSFDQYREGSPTLSRQQMRLAVISLTGKKPKDLPPGQKAFSLPDLYRHIHSLNQGSIIGDISSLYDELDQAGNGYLQVEDLVQAAQRNQANISVKVLEDAFNRVDTDRDGRISYREFITTVKTGLIELGVFGQ
jgi:hypothetical protein